MIDLAETIERLIATKKEGDYWDFKLEPHTKAGDLIKEAMVNCPPHSTITTLGRLIAPLTERIILGDLENQTLAKVRDLLGLNFVWNWRPRCLLKIGTSASISSKSGIYLPTKWVWWIKTTSTRPATWGQL